MAFRRARELLSYSWTEQQHSDQIITLIKENTLYYATDEANYTLLHHAAIYGNHEVVQYLVDTGSTVDARNDLGQTPLVSALVNDYPRKQVIDILLETDDFSFALKIVDSAAWLGENSEKFEIYKLFAENARHLHGFMVPATADEKVIKMFLQTNVDLCKVDSTGATLIHMLAKNSNPGIMSLLRGKNYDFNVRDRDAWTPLMYATLNGAADAAEFLLGEGADIEAVDVNQRTALYIGCDYVMDENVECIRVLLEHGANAQITIDDDSSPTVFHLFLNKETFFVGELVLAHLALQEANGTIINQMINERIEAVSQFKTYFELCKQQLSIEIYRSIKLLDILTASERRLENYLRNKDLASKLKNFKTVHYFKTTLYKRFSKAIAMIELRKTAALFICKFMKTDYSRHPIIADEIVSYLEQKDMECLIAI